MRLKRIIKNATVERRKVQEQGLEESHKVEKEEEPVKKTEK